MIQRLIIACSEKKLHASEPIAAGKLYRGSLFRVVENARRANPSCVGSLYVLSALHGLISERVEIMPYDQALHRADHDRFVTKLKETLSQHVSEFSEAEPVVACMSNPYRKALELTWRQMEFGTELRFIRGAPGVRAARLSDALRGELSLSSGLTTGCHYYAKIGERVFPAKVLAAEILGKPRSSFRTSDALRVLASKSIPIVKGTPE